MNRRRLLPAGSIVAATTCAVLLLGSLSPGNAAVTPVQPLLPADAVVAAPADAAASFPMGSLSDPDPGLAMDPGSEAINNLTDTSTLADQFAFDGNQPDAAVYVEPGSPAAAALGSQSSQTAIARSTNVAGTDANFNVLPAVPLGVLPNCPTTGTPTTTCAATATQAGVPAVSFATRIGDLSGGSTGCPIGGGGGAAIVQQAVVAPGPTSTCPQTAPAPEPAGTGMRKDPNPADMPTAICAQSDANNGAITYSGRYLACSSDTIILQYVVFDGRTWTLRGTAAVALTAIYRLKRNYQVWQNELKVNMYWASGTSSGWQINDKMLCSQYCSVRSLLGSGWSSVSLQRPIHGLYEVTANAPSAVRHVAQTFEPSFFNSGATVVGPTSRPIRGPIQRCENLPYFGTVRGACVFSQVRPTWVISRATTDVRYSAAHILRGQINLADHWGANYPTLVGQTLTRLTNITQITSNRTAACAKFVKRSATDSCDEFPMASTYQGARFVGPGRYSIEHVPLADNTTAGSRLGGFYKTQRVIDGDAFWIAVS